ncbi:hypothetical protein CARUB_v10003855mg [Capsella rubella]|uniref:glucan endo-1,3-beta-D-glucosidase n=1 Tax=Capsella rubella TaxID=81985 RepID=R0H1H8_9BRAS|nr:hypothetical protein CARUB_v10003855mg [Capsella rubella]
MLYSPKKLFFLFLSSIVLFVNYNHSGSVFAANSIGLNYGLLGDNLPSPIFDPNTEVLNALRGHCVIAVTVGVKDQDLNALAASEEAVKGWFTTNIEPYLANVKIAAVTVGNEVIPGPIGPQVLPVMLMQSLTNLVKSRNLPILISTVVAMSTLEKSYPPSAGMFTSQAREQLVPVLKLLSKQVRLYLFTPILTSLTRASDPANIRLDYAIFATEHVVVQDGPLSYSNMFDVFVPNKGIEGFLFATFNENQKPPGTEQNFGLYNPSDMKLIYKLF